MTYKSPPFYEIEINMANIRELPGKIGEFVNGRDHERRGATYLGLAFGTILLTPVIYVLPREAQEPFAKAVTAASVALLLEGVRQLDMARRRSRQALIA